MIKTPPLIRFTSPTRVKAKAIKIHQIKRTSRRYTLKKGQTIGFFLFKMITFFLKNRYNVKSYINVLITVIGNAVIFVYASTNISQNTSANSNLRTGYRIVKGSQKRVIAYIWRYYIKLAILFGFRKNRLID